MVDNRSAGFYGIGGSFNFKSGDPSGSAAKMSQEKYGSEAMYLPPVEDEEGWENFENQPFVDRSALLKATLNSLAMNNVASVLNAKKHKKKISLNNNENDDFDDEENLDSKNKREEFEHIFEEEQEG
ncbi:hypothetical protein J6R97_07845 [bacterium]|nr:hypothetical protein [bacterium]